MVNGYLGTGPDPAVYDFLQHDFKGLHDAFGGVVATTFRNYPSFPQRYMQAVSMAPVEPAVPVEPMKPPSQPMLYTEDDLQIRHFTDSTARRLARKGAHRAA
jgi:hypothetical protein